MKFIKTINEYLNPEKNIYVSYIFKEIQKKFNTLDDYEYEISDFFTYMFCNLKNKKRYSVDFITNIKKIIKKFNLKTVKNNILLTIDFQYSAIVICVKNIITLRVKPNKYVYHMTKKDNVGSIIKNGLIPKDSSNSHWLNYNLHFEYPPSIFVSNEQDDIFYEDDDNYIKLVINTSLLKNKWYYDLNMYNGGSIKNDLMTFESIPPEAISISK